MDEIKNTGHTRSWFLAITLLGVAVSAFLALSVEKVISPTIENTLSGMNVQWWFTAAATLLLFIILNLVISTASVKRFVANFFIIIGFKILLSAVTTALFLTRWDMLTAFQKATFFSPLTALVQVVAAFLLTLFLNGFYYAEDEMEEEIAAHFARPKIKLPEMEESGFHKEIETPEFSVATVIEPEKAGNTEIVTAEAVPESTEPVNQMTDTEMTAIPEEISREQKVSAEPVLENDILYKDSGADTEQAQEETFLSGEMQKRHELPEEKKIEEIAAYRDAILIRVDSITSQVPSHKLAMTAEEIRHAIGGEGLLPFPMQDIVEQLPEGVVYWDAADAFARLPDGALNDTADNTAKEIKNGKIELPLDEIIRQVPFEKLAVTSKFTENIGEELPDLFVERIDSEEVTLQPVETAEKTEEMQRTEKTVHSELVLENQNAETGSGTEKVFIKISATSIIKQLPDDEVEPGYEDILGKSGFKTVQFELNEILPQLPEGIVTVGALETLGKLPPNIFKREIIDIVKKLPSNKLVLPLEEIIPQVPAELLAVSAEIFEADDNYPDLFKETTPTEDENVLTEQDGASKDGLTIERGSQKLPAAPDEIEQKSQATQEGGEIYISIEAIIKQIPSLCLKMTVDEIKNAGITGIGLPMADILPMLEAGHVEWDASSILSRMPSGALSFPVQEAAESIPGGKFILPLGEIVSQIPAEKFQRSYSIIEEEQTDMPDMFVEMQEGGSETVESKNGEMNINELPENEPATEIGTESVETDKTPVSGQKMQKEASPDELSMPPETKTEEPELLEPREVETVSASAEEKQDISTAGREEPEIIDSVIGKDTADAAIEKTAEMEPLSAYDINGEIIVGADTETVSAKEETETQPVEQEIVETKEINVFEELEPEKDITEKMEYEEITAKISDAFASTEERETPLGEVMRGAFGPYPEGYVKPVPKEKVKPTVSSGNEGFDLSEECVKVSANYILTQIPPDTLGMSIDQIVTKLRTPGKIMIPQREVIPQLSEGMIEVEFIKIAPQFPPRTFIQPVEEIAKKLPHGGKVELQLKEVITQLPLEVFSSYEHKKPEEDVSRMPEPFGEFISESFRKSETEEKPPEDFSGKMKETFGISGNIKMPDKTLEKTAGVSSSIDEFKLAKDSEPLPEAFKLDLSALDFVPDRKAAQKPHEEEKGEKITGEAKTTEPAPLENVPIKETQKESLFEGIDINETPPTPSETEKLEFVGLTGEQTKSPEDETTEKPEAQIDEKQFEGSKLTEEDIREIEEILERARKQEEVKEQRLAEVMKTPLDEESAEEELEKIIQAGPSKSIEDELIALPPIESKGAGKDIYEEKTAAAAGGEGKVDSDDVQLYFDRLNLTNSEFYAYDGLSLIILTDEDTSCESVAGNAASVIVMLNDFGRKYGIGSNRKFVIVGQNGAIAAMSTLKSSGKRYVIAAEHDSGMAGQMSIFMEKHADLLEPVFKKGYAVARRIILKENKIQTADMRSGTERYIEQLKTALKANGIDRFTVLNCMDGRILAVFYTSEFPGELLESNEALFKPSLFNQMLKETGLGGLKTVIMSYDKFTITYSPITSAGAPGLICIFPAGYKEGFAKRKADKLAALCLNPSGNT